MRVIKHCIVLSVVLGRLWVAQSRWTCQPLGGQNTAPAGFVFYSRLGSRIVLERAPLRFFPCSRAMISGRSSSSPAKNRCGSPQQPPLPIKAVPSRLCSSLRDDEILSMDAVSLSNAIQNERSVTCEQLMKATLDRIEELNPTYNAIILLRDRDVLLQSARDCDWKLDECFGSRSSGNGTRRAPKRGTPKQPGIGWLHGIPVAIKDVSDAEGLPTTMGGSPLRSSEPLAPAKSSDPYVERMVREGAIVIGKTNAPEGGLGSNTFNEKWGKTLNPFAIKNSVAVWGNPLTTSISAGGSSGGAAVAVTTRMLALADGTDNLGSLRNPAGWNHVYSHRPTAGWIPSRREEEFCWEEGEEAATEHDVFECDVGSMPSSILPHPASTPGPMARTPLDCARLLQTMVGNPDRFDAAPLWHPDPEASSRTVRIGWLGDWQGALPMEDGILSTCQKALDDWSASSSHPPPPEPDSIKTVTNRISVETISAETDRNALFDLEKLWEGYNTIRFASTYETYSEQFDVDYLLSRRFGGNYLASKSVQKYVKDELAWELEKGRSIDGNALKRARAIYDDYEAWLRQILEGDDSFDFLALPSAQVWPFPIEERYPKAINGTAMDTYHRWMEVCIPVSFGGLPCVTIPAGFGGNPESTTLPPLPIGIQLFGKRGDDLALLRLANEYYNYTCRDTT